MEEQIKILQEVVNTLQTLEIKSTYDNMDKMLGCIQAIIQVGNALGQTSQGTEISEPIPINSPKEEVKK